MIFSSHRNGGRKTMWKIHRYHLCKRNRLRGFRKNTEKHQMTIRPKIFPNYNEFSCVIFRFLTPSLLLLVWYIHSPSAENVGIQNSLLSYFQAWPWAEESCVGNVITPCSEQPMSKDWLGRQYKGPDTLLQFDSTLNAIPVLVLLWVGSLLVELLLLNSIYLHLLEMLILTVFASTIPACKSPSQSPPERNQFVIL